MRSPAVLPALACVTGVACGIAIPIPVIHLGWALMLVCATVLAAALRYTPAAGRRFVVACVLCLAGVLHGAAARDAALHTRLRAVLDAAFGGFSIDVPGVVGQPEPVPLRAALTEDAADGGEFVSLRADSEAVYIDGTWRPVTGTLVLSVNGVVDRERIREWRAGRTIEVPVTFRRPAKFLNDGAPEVERDAALSGVTLFGAVKSGLLVQVVRRGTPLAEAAADARAMVRRAVTRWVTPHGAIPAAIVTAVLIGDRTGLPDDVRARLQAAGTYHVIAISGGNIAILAALIVGVSAAFGLHGRTVALTAIAVLLAYAQVASAGPSVWRATLMATLYFAARAFDHRTPPWHAMAVAAGVIAVVQPLDVRDAGFLLTFGATAGLLGIAGVSVSWMPRHRIAAWVAASMVSSLAVEIVVLPVSATVFSRVTVAGLVLNLLAVPAMAVAQVAGMVVVAFAQFDAVASVAGWIAAHAAAILVESAKVVELLPPIVRRVPPPSAWIVAGYYLALLAAWRSATVPIRMAGGLVLGAAALLIVAGVDPLAASTHVDAVRLTMVDVGQGESMLLEVPGGDPVLIDAGGSPFGGGAFDIGARVVTPALWARGVRRLGGLLVTHGDPDHLGGAASVLADFRPRVLWWGVSVPRHQPSRLLLEEAAHQAVRIDTRRAGQETAFGRARLRVLNPPEPEWERQRVRNDDSVVVEVVYGDVALLLTGDISAEVERRIAPLLTPAGVRVLKVAHHGSRTSSSRPLLDSWRPQIALISCGRGNTFGHPAPEVIERLESIGARIYRTDRDGEITLETDGRRVAVRTFVGEPP